jgi:hypothetical protein
MSTTSMTILAVLLLIVAAYAQLQVPRYTADAAQARITRIVLLSVGIALGAVSAAILAEAPAALLAFAIGFGVVHVPAAAILLLKRARGAGRS